MDARARRAAKRIRLAAIKTHWRAGSVDNWGGFQIVDPLFNRIEAGVRFNMTAEEVIAFAE